MRIIKAAYRYLKRYPVLTVSAFLSMLASSVFEGVSFGMLVPLIQSMINAGQAPVQNMPFIKYFVPAGTEAGQVKAVSIIFCAIFVALCLKNVFLYMSSMLNSKLRLGITRDLSASLVDRLIGYDIAYFDRSKTGHMATNIDAETTRIGIFILCVLNFVLYTSRVVSYVVVLFVISWKASAALFVMIAGVLLPLEIMMRRLTVLSDRLSAALRDFSFKMLEILNGIRLIKERGAEERERASFRAAADGVFDCYYRLNRYNNMLVPLSESVIFGLLTVSFVALVNFTKVDVKSSFPYIAAYMVILVKMLTQLNQLNSMRSTALSNVAALDNYEAICDETGKRTISSGVTEPGRLKDGIMFDRVDFAYEPTKLVFRSLDLVVPKGKMLAIVGSSGAGKTTVVNLILRFYDPVAGRVLIDGKDLRALDLHLWRKKIGVVSQNFFLFNSTVRDNIAYGSGSVPFEKVLKAATIAHADEFIQKLPEKYDTVIGERGVQLSGGQRQRLSIARAVIEDPEILILDEATSALDSETEALISEALEAAMSGRTVIAIAHRLATVMKADKIVVLDGSRVVAQGTHSSLLKDSVIYRKLYETQFDMR